jgi:predicted exporter
LIAWLVLVAVCVAWLSRNLTIGADLTVFLPPSTNPSQRLLVSQLRDGVSTRLLLIALEGEEPPVLAQASRELAGRLRGERTFRVVNNGDLASAGKERDLLVAYRYLLSPAVSAGRFHPGGFVRCPPGEPDVARVACRAVHPQEPAAGPHR